MPIPSIEQFERLIRRDPARRGLISTEPLFGPLCEGHLAQSADHLAKFGTHVAIVTGFFIPTADQPAAETDGPPGALILADALLRAGIETRIVTDSLCVGSLLAGADAVRYPRKNVVSYAVDQPDDLASFFDDDFGRQLTHLVSIERVGPSHTRESLVRQDRTIAPPVERFCQLVPGDAFDHCHNMRGRVIDQYTAPLHRLFEMLPASRPAARSIGIGDGANEIGMGSIAWEDLQCRLQGDMAARIPCRIPTDWTIVAGTSNWGGYALAAATLLLRDQPHLLAKYDRTHEQRVLEHLVKHGPTVDGVTGQQEASVDGLPFLTYIQPWEGMREILGFDSH